MNGQLGSVLGVTVSSATSLGVASSVDASPLLTALITLGVSIVTFVGGEIVKYLVAYFKKKTEDLKVKSDKKDE